MTKILYALLALVLASSNAFALGNGNGNPTGTTSGGSGITALTGDVTASGTGSVAATVNSIGGDTVTLGGSFTTSGANALTLTTTASTNVTLPTSGTLVNTGVATLSSLTSIGTLGTLTVSGNVTFSGLNATGTVAGAMCQTSAGLYVYKVGANCFAGGGTAGGSAGQIQWNSAGSLAGFTMSGDATLVTSTGVITVSSIGGKTVTLGSTFITSGANSLTLTTTGATNVTLPTSGTLTTTSNNLSVFASTTSSQLAGVISDETGTGALVFAGSPTLTGTVGAAAITATGVVTGGFLLSPASALTISTSTFTPAAVGSNDFRVVATSACPCTIANPSGTLQDGEKFTLEIWQDATGSRTFSFGTSYDFGTAGAPTLSTGASKGDVLGFIYSAQDSKLLYLGIQQGF